MTGARCLAGGTAAATREGRWLAAAYPPQRIHFLASHGEAQGGRRPQTEAKMTSAIADAVPEVAVRGFSLEFGTYAGERVFLAERREHWEWARRAR